MPPGAEAIRPEDLFNALGGGGGSIQFYEEGVLVASRAKVNFIGDGITAEDDAVNSRVNITVSGTTGPQGPEGPAGPEGPEGPQGPAGANGTNTIGVRDAGVLVGTRGKINFIEGANITLTIVDDAANDEVELTIAASGGGGSATGHYRTPDVTAADWVEPYGPGTIAGTSTNANILRAVPLYLAESVTFDRIQIEVTTLGASSLVRLGIYNDNGGRPGALNVELGTVDSTSTGIKTLTISVTLAAGVYWLVAGAETAAVGIRMYASHVMGMPSNSASMSGSTACYTGTNAAPGSLPANFPAASLNSAGPRFMLRVA
jgi:hypothetical protein